VSEQRGGETVEIDLVQLLGRCSAQVPGQGDVQPFVEAVSAREAIVPMLGPEGRDLGQLS
jgi:hypothetical protein